MKKSIRAVLFLLASALTAVTAPQLLPVAQAAPSGDCPKAVIVALRGSGEGSIGPQNYGNISSSGWEGNTLSRLLKRAYSTFPEIADIPVLGVDESYEAISVPLGAATNTFERSIASGVRGTIATYDLFRVQKHRDCAPQMILLGYSQGAAVARKVAAAVESRGVATAVMTVGDPMQKPDADGVFGGGSNGSGIWRGNGNVRDGHDRFYQLPNLRRASICHDRDPVCDFYITSDITVGPHKNYFEDGVKFQSSNGAEPSTVDEVDFMASALRTNVEIARNRYDKNSQVSRMASDTVIAIDTTGSMSGLIANARNQADNLAQRLLDTNPSSRIGIVEYRDHGDAFVSRTVVDFTNDRGRIRAGLDGLVADGGGDWPEAVYSGVAQSLSFPFSVTSARSIIIIGDAPAHDPEPMTGFTSADVIEALNGRVSLTITDPSMRAGRQALTESDRNAGQAGPEPTAPEARSAVTRADAPMVVGGASTGPGSGLPVTLYGIGTADLVNTLDSIASATGGSTFDIDSGIDFGDALGSAIDSIESAPKTILDIEPVVAVGYETSIGCGGSTGGTPPLQMSVEVEGQTLDCANLVSYTFQQPGTHEVTLRVVDAEGRQSTATATVEAIVPDPQEETPGETPGTGSAGGFPGTGSASGLPGTGSAESIFGR
ncbi:cutinase family protein [Rhodococcus sp. HS-D2]|uniref:cutinase family protein n=1 Tax=Rhodococcus sp. HS-D2 TaxID=1384636 RepID=UPI0009EE66DD|nr:cutinase family protein [Rhodococcus sp. HS-D2]